MSLIETQLKSSLALYHERFLQDPIAPNLREYAQEQRDAFAHLSQFLGREALALSRHCQAGHITASALVVDQERQSVLLTYHKRLQKWLQLGGHLEADPFVYAGAAREAKEESGLAQLSFCPHPLLWDLKGEHPLPFDLDVHTIPARKGEPEHLHFDLRFLLLASSLDHFQISEESEDLQWLSLERAKTLTTERSMLRQFAKISFFLS